MPYLISKIFSIFLLCLESHNKNINKSKINVIIMYTHQMDQINNEYKEFKKYHTNIYNVLFHIICGVIYMVLFFLLFKKNEIFVLGLYALLLLLTLENTMIAIITSLILYCTLINIKDFNIDTKYIIGLFLLFYFLPDVSHYLTNEKTILTMESATLFDIFVNIFYLLPFSIQSLSNTK